MVAALGRALRTFASLAVLGGIAALAHWGHTTEWTFSPSREDPEHVRAEPASPPLIRGERIEFASKEDVEAAGITVSAAWTTNVVDQVYAAGEVQFDPTRVVRLSARSGGVVRHVMKGPGDRVTAGELLFVLDAVEVGRAKAELQQALGQVRLRRDARDLEVKSGNATSEAVIREAEAAYQAAEVRLRAASQSLVNLGLPVEIARYRDLPPQDSMARMSGLGVEDLEVALGGESSTLLPVRAPFAGVMLKTDVVSGAVVEPGAVLGTVLDPTRVRIVLHLPTDAANRVRIEQPAWFRPDGAVGEYVGVVEAVGTRADEATRTVPVFIGAANPDAALRASTLGRGRVVFREVKNCVVAPICAVHVLDGRSVVFVRDQAFLAAGPKAFHVQTVTTGARDEKNVEIRSGLAPGELVVESGSKGLLAEWRAR